MNTGDRQDLDPEILLTCQHTGDKIIQLVATEHKKTTTIILRTVKELLHGKFWKIL